MMESRVGHKQKLLRQDNVAAILWVVFFCYSISAALIFQKVVLPLVPSMHAVGGLIANDAIYFDMVALELANQINQHGWASWQLFPATGAMGNVAILGALYAVFGHDPTLIIPINAAIHALGGMLIFLLAREISSKESVGIYTGIIAGSLFVVFPSALNWYGQLHKDGYAIAGSLLIFLSWVKALRGCADWRGWSGLITLHACGVVLVGIVRPYNLKLLLVFTLLAWLAIAVVAISRRQWRRDIAFIKFLLVAAITLVFGIIVTSHISVATSASIAPSALGETYADWQGDGKWRWMDAAWLPDALENYIETTAKTRAAMIGYGLGENAKSMIDQEVTPQSVVEVMGYMPRALQVALFAPFPNTWLTNLSMARLVALAEMVVFYLCIPGVLLLLMYNRTRSLWLALFFSSFFLAINGSIIANIGTLYRVRYAYEMIVLMLGVLGWLTWLDKSGRLARLLKFMSPSIKSVPSGDMLAEVKPPARKEALTSGMWVMALTFLCFGGFFIRDILMAHNLGLGAELDNFFIALMIPMLIVTVLSLPLGAAFVPVYLETKESLSLLASKNLVTSTSSWSTAVLLIVCVLLFMNGPILLPMFYIKGTSPDIKQLTTLLDISLPILFFSGMVVLGNAVLNASGRAVLSSAAQLVVPLLAILALQFFGTTYGVQAVMYGMVAGQMLNLLLIQFYLKRQDVSVLPNLASLKVTDERKVQLAPLLPQYFPLAASALFISIAAPVSTLLAMSLPEGAVSAFSLGNKVVLFVTGLVGAAVGTVMLPYFSAMVSKNHLVGARRELSLFLLFATFISVPISATLYTWAEPIIRLAFERGTFDSEATAVVTRVMQYSVVQLPFFVCNAFLLKFATATKHVLAICIVAIIGFLINVAASLLLMKHMGVAGIALGMTVSMVISTIMLTLVLVRYGHITGFDAVVMLMNWLLYVTLLIGVHFGSLPSILATVFAYFILFAGYVKSWSYDDSIRMAP